MTEPESSTTVDIAIRGLKIAPAPAVFAIASSATWLGGAGARPGRGAGQGNLLVLGVQRPIVSAARGIDGGSALGGFGDRRRVLDPSMVNADHHVGHRFFHQVEVAERQITFVELTVADESLEHSVDVIPNTLGAPIFEGAG